MAKRYTSTIQTKARKEHHCISCQSTYSYLLERKVSAQSGKPEVAEQKAQQQAAQVLATQVDQHPCPSCGIFQPDMIGQARAKRHKQVFWIALLLFVVLLIMQLAYAFPANRITLYALVIAAIAVALHLMAELKNLNRDTDANRLVAAQRVTSGLIKHVAVKRLGPQVTPAHSPRNIVQLAAIAVLAPSLLLIARPEIVRSTKGWAANSDSYPPVVGPGDVARIYMSDSIVSIKSYWKGEPHIKITAPGAEPIEASAKTNENSWGDTIYAKSDEKNGSSTPWVEVLIPAEPNLAGKTVECAIELDVLYPESNGPTFTEKSKSMRRTVPLSLAAAGAGAQYMVFWWQGTVAGMAVILVCGLILLFSARSLQRQAKTTLLGPPGGPSMVPPPIAAPARQVPSGAVPPPIPPR